MDGTIYTPDNPPGSFAGDEVSVLGLEVFAGGHTGPPRQLCAPHPQANEHAAYTTLTG